MAGALRTALVVLIVFAGPGPATAGQSAPGDPRTALIVGQVIDAGTGRPVGSALVQLTGGPPPPRTPGSPLPPSRPRLMADAEGRFAFRGLAAGSYNVTIFKPGYSDGAYGRRRPGGTAQPLPLASGEKAGDVRISMWRNATISGSVVDEAGEPIVDVEVRALRRTLVGGRRRFTAAAPSLGMPRQVVTDDRGVYRIPSLIPGDYVVVAVSTVTSVPASLLQSYRDAIQSGAASSGALFTPMFEAGASNAMPGTPTAMAAGGTVLSLQRTITPPPPRAGRLFVYPTTYYPASFTAADAGVVTIGSGDDRAAVDFQLRPVPTARVAGTITSADGPVTSVALTLSASIGVADTEAIAGAVTDGNGAFTFPAVPVGQYTLRVVKQPATPTAGRTTTMIQAGSNMAFTTITTGSSGPQPLPTDPTLWATLPVSVGRTDVTNLAVVLQNGPRVSGRVEFEGTAPKPLPERIAALPLSIEADVPRPAALSFATIIGSAQWQARFDPSGTFRSVSVPAGRYFVRVPTAPTGWTFKSATLNGRDVAEAPLDLQADATGVVITFTDTPIELSGVATASTGAPDPDATVLIFPSDPQAWNAPAPASRRFRSVRTGKDGSYKTTGLPAGSYYLVAIPDEAAGEWMEPKYLEQLSRLATEIRVDDAEKRTQELKTREVR